MILPCCLWSESLLGGSLGLSIPDGCGALDFSFLDGVHVGGLGFFDSCIAEGIGFLGSVDVGGLGFFDSCRTEGLSIQNGTGTGGSGILDGFHCLRIILTKLYA